MYKLFGLTIFRKCLFLLRTSPKVSLGQYLKRESALSRGRYLDIMPDLIIYGLKDMVQHTLQKDVLSDVYVIQVWNKYKLGIGVMHLCICVFTLECAPGFSPHSLVIPADLMCWLSTINFRKFWDVIADRTSPYITLSPLTKHPLFILTLREEWRGNQIELY